jgi:hypothetical protein
MGINSDMDRYLRDRRRSKTFEVVNSRSGPSWWDNIFKARKEIPNEFTPEEEAKLHAMETEIKQGEAQLERASPQQEQELEAEQEKRVSLYQQFVRLFQREHKLEDAYEQVEQQPAAVIDASVADDFRTLAGIQMRWFDRLPTRIKDEFKESDDYKKYVEILQRRGVAKKR